MSTGTSSNFLVTANPWHLAAPPQWWLQKLFDQDADLVVFPSQHRMAYILARRRRQSSSYDALVKVDENLLKMSAGLDGDLLTAHNLIYVRHLIGNTVRRMEIFQWLKDHDVWEAGGGEAAANLIESEEAYREEQKRAKMIEDIDYRAKDAWRSYQARTGRRQGYGQRTTYKPSAKIMPVTGFSPAESSVAMFGRD